MSETRVERLTVTSIGAQGDGLAIDRQGHAHHIPFALPEETWSIEGHGVPRLETPHPERSAPPCPHFGTCGGCVAQHMPEALYRAWKRSLVVDALRHRGLEPSVGALATIPPASRRRATLAARLEPTGVVLGFHGRRSHELIAIETCSVLDPRILALFPALARLTEALAGGRPEIRLAVTMTDTGGDVDVEGPKEADLGARSRAHLAAIAREARLARLSLSGVPVAELEAPSLTFAGKQVVPPPGAFLQAAPAAEAAITALVLEALGRAKKVADLFCGVGTLTLPVAVRARALAIDSEPALIAALAAAVRTNQGLKPIETRVRDLFRDPLSAIELKAFDAVVLDPPRAGARAQCERIAASKVARVVMVSCNPATMARDLRTLVDGGFRIDAVTPIDQFVWSAHVEAVVVLVR